MAAAAANSSSLWGGWLGLEVASDMNDVRKNEYRFK
jgi:hypothetical protein